jgi:membrane-associated phospholipid phosphatase
MKCIVVTAVLLAALAAHAAGAAEPPALPGVATDVIAAAEKLDSREPATGHERWFTAERAKQWAPAVALTAAAITVDLAASPPRHPRWNDHNDFDDSIRNGLVGDSRSTRDAAATASTVLVAALGAGLAADIYFERDQYDLEQSVAVAAAATAATQLTTESAKVIAGRERPYVRRCLGDPRYSDSCDSGREDNTSFFSMHASQSATMAGLVCVRRLHRPGATWMDGVACGTAAAASAATGVLRIVADEHYATDVLAGWGTGALFGVALPLVFRRWSGIDDDERAWSIAPLAGAGGLGFQYTSRF